MFILLAIILMLIALGVANESGGLTARRLHILLTVLLLAASLAIFIVTLGNLTGTFIFLGCLALAGMAVALIHHY